MIDLEKWKFWLDINWKVAYQVNNTPAGSNSEIEWITDLENKKFWDNWKINIIITF